ncbi:HAD hydrolase-like protein [bacterium]|nr:HAD hydrolase-like protein [bacterium]
MTSPATQRLFLYDIDGTILSTNHSGYRSFVRSCREVLGIEGPIDGIHMAGKLDRVIFEEIVAAYRPELSGADLLPHWETFRDGYVRYLRQESLNPSEWILYPGVRELVEMSQGLGALALLTGNVREGAMIKLATLDMARYFPTGGFGENSITREQLAHLAYDEACRHFGVTFPPERSVVIGDTVRDVRAGQAIGARTLAVATGTVSEADLVAAGADLVAPDFLSARAEVESFLAAL